MDATKILTMTLDRRTEAVLIEIGYTVDHSQEDGAPMTVQIVWINPETIKATLTEAEWELIHAYLWREEQRHLQQNAPRSTLDPLI